MNSGSPQSCSAPTTVGLRVSATPDQLVMLRALAETVTYIADFGIDEVSDIRLALDEIATVVIGAAVPGSTLDCDLSYDEHGLSARIAAVTAAMVDADGRGLGWHIVRTLTDTLEIDQGPYAIPQRGYPIVIEFRRLRQHARGPGRPHT
ncbi:ATP-binding protein [Nocardia sp. NPDC058058]|uniref:ATP-binding protein n=1 Tax=Nocardia sp. NPDC058058 TaxID=3346317 RepID=UPI0036DF0D75